MGWVWSLGRVTRCGTGLALTSRWSSIWCSSASSWVASFTWRWPLIIWAHIPAVIYGALVEFAGFACPLTLLENDLRQRAGEAGYREGFIAHYLVKVIYPPGLTHGMQIGLGVLLLLVAIIGYCGFRVDVGRGWREPWQLRARSEHTGAALSGAS